MHVLTPLTRVLSSLTLECPRSLHLLLKGEKKRGLFPPDLPVTPLQALVSPSQPLTPRWQGRRQSRRGRERGASEGLREGGAPWLPTC